MVVLVLEYGWMRDETPAMPQQQKVLASLLHMYSPFAMYISRLLLTSTATWVIATTVTDQTVSSLQQVVSSSSSSPTTINVCQNKACCQRWKLKTPLPDVLHDIIISNENYNNKKRIVIETSSCLGHCDKGPNLRISNPFNNENEDIYVHGIIDVISLITQLDETVSITVPSKLLAAVTVFEKAQTGTFP